MVEGLFFLNLFFAFVVIFTTKMVENHLNQLDKSIQIYLNPKVYKPEEKVCFLTTLLQRYQDAQALEEGEVQLDIMLENMFTEEKIGIFNYTTIQGIATRGGMLLWLVGLLQVGLAFLINFGNISQVEIVYCVANILLCMTVTLMGVLNDVWEAKQELMYRMEDYVLHAYPVELNNKKEHQVIQTLLERIDELEEKLTNQVLPQEESPQEEEINALTEADMDLLMLALKEV